MRQIKFVRVERDCDANKNNRAAGNTRALIYDFDVTIDGERRAQFRRIFTGKGYELYDVDFRSIGIGRRSGVGYGVENQSYFESTIDRFLSAGLIPTIARMAELRAAEAAAKEAKRVAAAEHLRVQRIQGAGVELYEALKAAKLALRSSAGPEEKMNADRAAAAAIATAELTLPDDDEWIAAMAMRS